MVYRFDIDFNKLILHFLKYFTPEELILLNLDPIFIQLEDQNQPQVLGL